MRGDIVNQQGAGSAAVIAACDAAEALLPRRVPELELDAFAGGAGADADDAAAEFDADGLRGEDAEFLAYEAVEETGFAGARGTEEDDLCEVVVEGVELLGGD